jgi:hypothetical protein
MSTKRPTGGVGERKTVASADESLGALGTSLAASGSVSSLPSSIGGGGGGGGGGASGMVGNIVPATTSVAEEKEAREDHSHKFADAVIIQLHKRCFCLEIHSSNQTLCYVSNGHRYMKQSVKIPMRNQRRKVLKHFAIKCLRIVTVNK